MRSSNYAFQRLIRKRKNISHLKYLINQRIQRHLSLAANYIQEGKEDIASEKLSRLQVYLELVKKNVKIHQYSNN